MGISLFEFDVSFGVFNAYDEMINQHKNKTKQIKGNRDEDVVN